MADAASLNRMLTLLTQQTDFGNVVWREAWDPDTFEYVATKAAVVIGSRDGDAALPFRLSIANGEGMVTDRWTIYGLGVDTDEVPDAAPEYIAAPARDLYYAVKRQAGGDPVKNLLDELEGMPPF